MTTAESASSARIYDYLIGGSHHRPVDRDAAERIRTLVPGIAGYCLTSRRFLGRAVRQCVRLGVTCFVDVGSGLPTTGNVHDVVDASLPVGVGRVVYVDCDPAVCAEASAVLDRTGDWNRHAVVRGDVLDPDGLWAAVDGTGLVDRDRPVALVTNALWHFVPDSARPTEALARHRAAVAPGSLLVLSQMTGEDPIDEVEARRLDDLVSVYRSQGLTARLRDSGEIRRLFDGWDVLEPGVVPVAGWRPDSRTPFASDPARCRVVGGLARRPDR